MKNKYGKMKRKPCRLPLLLTFVRGAIGKEYVIKHYRYGIIKTKYPNMTGIIASTAQRSYRDLFKASVKKAQQVMADPEKKAAWLKKIRQKHRLFNQLVKFYMLAEKKATKKRRITGDYMLRSCFKLVTAHTKSYETENAFIQPTIQANRLPVLVYRE